MVSTSGHRRLNAASIYPADRSCAFGAVRSYCSLHIVTILTENHIFSCVCICKAAATTRVATDSPHNAKHFSGWGKGWYRNTTPLFSDIRSSPLRIFRRLNRRRSWKCSQRTNLPLSTYLIKLTN